MNRALGKINKDRQGREDKTQAVPGELAGEWKKVLHSQKSPAHLWFKLSKSVKHTHRWTGHQMNGLCADSTENFFAKIQGSFDFILRSKNVTMPRRSFKRFCSRETECKVSRETSENFLRDFPSGTAKAVHMALTFKSSCLQA